MILNFLYCKFQYSHSDQYKIIQNFLCNLFRSSFLNAYSIDLSTQSVVFISIIQTNILNVDVDSDLISLSAIIALVETYFRVI